MRSGCGVLTVLGSCSVTPQGIGEKLYTQGVGNITEYFKQIDPVSRQRRSTCNRLRSRPRNRYIGEVDGARSP